MDIIKLEIPVNTLCDSFTDGKVLLGWLIEHYYKLYKSTGLPKGIFLLHPLVKNAINEAIRIGIPHHMENGFLMFDGTTAYHYEI